MKIFSFLFLVMAMAYGFQAKAGDDFIPENPQSCSIDELKKRPLNEQYCQMLILMSEVDFQALSAGSEEFGVIIESGVIAPGQVIFSTVVSLQNIVAAQSDPRVLAIVPNLPCSGDKCDFGNGSFTVKN